MSVRKLAGQTAIYGLSSIAGRALNYLLSPYYTHYLAPGELGIYTDLISWTFYGLVFLTFGMETGFFNYVDKARNPEQVYSNAFLWVSILGTLFMALGLLVHIPLALGLGYPDSPGLVLMVILITVLDALSALPMARLRYQNRAYRFAFISLSNIGLTILLTVLFFTLLEPSVYYIFLANVIASSIKLILALDGNLPRYWRFQAATLRTLQQYGGFIMLMGMLGAINELADRNLLPRLWPDGQEWDGQPRSGEWMNGIYANNYKLAMLISLFTQAYRYAAEPYFFKNVAEKKSKANMARVFHYFMLVNLATMLLVTAFVWELVRFDAWGLLPHPIFNERYHTGHEVIPLLLLANVFLGAYINISMWYKLTGYLRIGLGIAVVGALITLAVNVATIPWLGFVGSALATLLCYGTMAVLCYRLGQRYYPVPYQIPRLVLYGLVAFGVGWLLLGLSMAGYAGPGLFVFKVLLCGALLAGGVWVERRYPV